MFPAYDEDKQKRMQNLFNTMQGIEFPEQEQAPVEAPVQPQRGPFSSIFNYDEEVARQEETFARREEMNEKIARGNAITDGFNLLISGLGGAAGATIPKNTPNKSVFNALNDYRAMDKEKRDRLDRFRMLDINNMTRDLQYRQGLEAEQRGRDFTGEQKEIDRAFTTEEKAKDRTFQAGEKVETRTFTEEQKEKDRQARAKLQERTIQGKKDIEQQRADLGHYSYQDRAAYNKKGFNIRGVSITPDLEVKMVRALQEMYEGDLNKPKVLKSVDRNENINEESVRDLFLQHWDQLRELIPELSGSQTREEMVATPKANNQQKDTSAYDTLIEDAATRTDWRYGKRLKTIRDAFIEGYGLSKDEAEKRAKERLGPK